MKRLLRTASVVGSIIAFGVVALPGTPAQARPRSTPTTTTTTTTTTPPPTTIPATVPTPTSSSVVIVPANTYAYQFSSLFYVQVNPATRLGDAELLSGPTVGGEGIVLVNDFGRVSFLRVVAGSDYVFRYRNKVYSSTTGTFTFSPWVQFSFRAPVLP
jgi:hypothetical protein